MPEKTTHEILHIIRNPWGWSEDEVRAARLAAADLIEQQAKDVETLNSVSKAMARTGMQIRNDLAEAKLKNIEQAKQIEALKSLLSDIKLFEVDSGVERMKKGEPVFVLPIELRKRMQEVLR